MSLFRNFRHNAIGINGDPGSGKTTLLRALKNIYGLEEVYVGGDLKKEHLDWQQQDPKNRMQVSFPEYYRNREIVSVERIRGINSLIRERVSRGRVILDSRFLPLNCKGLNMPLIYLTARLQTRATRAYTNPVSPHFSGGDTTDFERKITNIENILEQRKADEIQMGLDCYGIDFSKKLGKYYHCILDTSDLSKEEVIEEVINVLG